MIFRSVRDWWWPAFVFVYPLLATPGGRGKDLASAFTLRAYLTVGFIIGGIVLELLLPDWRAVSVRQLVTRSLGRHRAVAVALIFAGWVVFAALFDPVPAFALTGSLITHGDGALWMVAMVTVFVLIYVRTLHTPRVGRRIAQAIVASGLVLTAAATAELLLRHGLIFHVADQNLPMVSFPQKGHLSGMLALAGGVALGVWPLTITPVLAYGIGLCLNRSAAVALLTGALTQVLRVPRAAVSVLAVTALAFLGVVGGGAVSKAISTAPKQVASASTLESRSYYYRAALRGIVQRPVVGWGGGNFQFAWPRFLSEAELARFGKIEWGFQDVLSVNLSDASPPVLAVRDRSGKLVLTQVRTFKAHDQILEAALMWGLIGAALYLTLVGLAVRGVLRGEPLALGVLVYFLFLLFWFVIPETQGVLWAMLGGAIAMGRVSQRGAAQEPTLT